LSPTTTAIFSEGIHALAAALQPLGDVTIVAPHAEASAVGHALTLKTAASSREDWRIGFIRSTGRRQTASTSASMKCSTGGPTSSSLESTKGSTSGDDVTYSGTVAGAFEGALLGHQSIAVSLQFTKGSWDFRPAASHAAAFAAILLEQPLPYRTFLNINVPQAVSKACG